MTFKMTPAADGLSATLGVGANDALKIDDAAKTIKPVAPYRLTPAGAFFRGRLASFNNTLTGSGEVVTLTPTASDGVTIAGSTVKPLISGWYQVSISCLCTGSAGALGAGITTSTGASIYQIQPPYTSNSAYVSATNLVHFNGTTDTASFNVFGSVAGCNFSDIVGSLVLVRADT